MQTVHADYLRSSPIPAVRLSFLLSAPSIASTACGFSRDGDTMTIVVGKQANSCFSSKPFREAWMADMNEAFNEEEIAGALREKRFDDRSKRAKDSGRSLDAIIKQPCRPATITARNRKQLAAASSSQKQHNTMFTSERIVSLIQ